MASISVRSPFGGWGAPVLTRRRSASPLLLCSFACWLVASPASGQNATLGTINFPNSGASAAQPFFIEGVKFLHSFEWEDAADRFRKAQQADPGFALEGDGQERAQRYASAMGTLSERFPDDDE